MRKLLAILLSVLMVVSVLSFSISAEEPAYVAKIVKADKTEKSYTVIGSAANDLANGDTLVILADINEEVDIVPPAGTVTIEGNKNVKMTDLLLIKSPESGNAVVNIKNLVIEQKNGRHTFQVQARNTINMDNCYLIMDNSGSVQAFSVSKSYNKEIVVNVKNTTIESKPGSKYNTYLRVDTTATFENCLFIADCTNAAILADKPDSIDGMQLTSLIHCYIGCLNGAIKLSIENWPILIKNSTLDYYGEGDGVLYFNKKGQATVDNVHFINSAATACLSGQSNSSSSVLGARFENPTHVKDMNASNKKVDGLPGDPETVVPSSAAYLDFNGFDASKVAKKNAVGYVPEADPDAPTPPTGDNFAMITIICGAALTMGTAIVIKKKKED